MFKNREIRMNLVKKAKDDAPPSIQNSTKVTYLVTKDQMTRAAVLVGGLYTTKAVVNTACIIAVHVAKHKFQ